jgi:hypothetical protein
VASSLTYHVVDRGRQKYKIFPHEGEPVTKAKQDLKIKENGRADRTG